MAISEAVDQSAVARTVGIKVEFRDLRGGRVLFLPQRIALIGQGNSLSTYSLDKRSVFSAQEIGETYGFGSPLHLAGKQLFPTNGDGVGSIPVTVYPLEDDASGVAATGNILFAGTQTSTESYTINIGSVSTTFVLNEGDADTVAATTLVAAINGVPDMPVIAAVNGGTPEQVDLTAKWEGVSTNDIITSVDGNIAGITIAITQLSGGLVNPDIDDALNNIGEVWETIIINPMEYTDTDTLDKIATFGEGRWGALTKKPLFALTGSQESTVATLTAFGDARKTDRINSLIPAPDSVSLPVEIAARAAARIAVQANNNPPVDYASKQISGILPGGDDAQWNYVERDALVKAGISTTELIDNIIELSDTVTFYHPTGEEPPAYRYVVDIVKLQNIVFNLRLIFESDNWKGKVLLPNDTPTVNADARKPKDAKAAIFVLIDNLALNAIISDPVFAKESTLTEISSTNPKRLDIQTTVKLSGNTNIISIDLFFGFFFGTLQAAV